MCKPPLLAVFLSLSVVMLPVSYASDQAAAPVNGPVSDLAAWVDAAFTRHSERNLVDAERRVGEALGYKAAQWLADAPAANVKYQTDTIGSDLGYREWEGGVDLPLWWPGQRDRYRAEASSSATLADAMSQAIRLQKAGAVRERVWAVALAEAERNQAALTRDAAQKLLNDVTRRVVAGELPRRDRLLAEKTVLAEQDNLHRAENQLSQKKAVFSAYTGVSADIRVQPEVLTTRTEISFAHPLLSWREQQVSKARAHRDRVRSERRSTPTVWLGAKTSRAAIGASFDDAVGVELTIPFGSEAHAGPDNAEAEQLLTQAITERDRLRRELKTALQQAQLELQGRAELASRAERRQVLGEESLKLSQRAFELGETDLIRLLQAQADASEARQSLLLSRLQYQRAIAMLNQASGVIPQ